MQQSLQTITQALADRISPVMGSETTPEPTPNEHNQIVLASNSLASTGVVNKRMSVFGTIGWLFGSGGGAKKHKRGQSIATSTPASVAAAPIL